MPSGVYSRWKNLVDRKRKFSQRHVKLSCGCWIYLGNFSINIVKRGPHSKKTKYPTRGRTKLAWEIYKGGRTSGLQLLHKCDISECENPKHLFEGTQSENIQGMYDRGRDNLVVPKLKGEDNGCAKLTEAQVIRIRKLYSQGYTQIELGEMFGVTHTTISYIIHRKLWKHI